jgi:hypothetical protein
MKPSLVTGQGIIPIYGHWFDLSSYRAWRWDDFEHRNGRQQQLISSQPTQRRAEVAKLPKSSRTVPIMKWLLRHHARAFAFV